MSIWRHSSSAWGSTGTPRLGVDGDSRLVGGGAEDIECDGEAEGLVDEGLDGGLASHQPLQAGGGGVVSVTHITTYYDESPALRRA